MPGSVLGKDASLVEGRGRAWPSVLCLPSTCVAPAGYSLEVS